MGLFKPNKGIIRARLCPACGGTGKRPRDTFQTPSVTCFWCGGRGEVAE